MIVGLDPLMYGIMVVTFGPIICMALYIGWMLIWGYRYL